MADEGVPRFFRTMIEDDGKPQIGTRRCELGVRPPGGTGRPDIDVEPTGEVALNHKGMSVFRSLDDLKRMPTRLLPQHLWQKVRGAAGGSKDAAPPQSRVWSMGNGAFASGAVTAELALEASPDWHGTIVPRRSVQLADFQGAIAGTQSLWTINEP